jgi:hypothetical protein
MISEAFHACPGRKGFAGGRGKTLFLAMTLTDS